jgi:rubrerythrin
MRRGLAVGGVALAAASVPSLLFARNAFAQADGDAAVLEGAVGLEQVAVFAYTAAIDSGLLDAGTTKVARQFRDHEQEHADGLITALEALGGKAPAKPMAVGDSELLAPLADVKNAGDIVTYAIELETMAVAAYYDAHQKLQDAELLQTGAQIMANEGQHLVVLRQAAKQPPVPNAFETGEATS